jgi:methionine aminotransferase
VQYGIADMLLDKSRHQSLSNFFQQKRDYFLKLIQGSRFEFVPTHGTYFQLLSYKNIDTRNEYDMAMHAIKEHGLSSIPVSSFYHDGESQQILRFCFAKKNETLEQAAELLCKI